MELLGVDTAILETKQKLRLPDSYEKVVTTWLMPIADGCVSHMLVPNKEQKARPFILGVQGTQGSGKSTCSEFLKILFEEKYRLKTVVLSIDDFYLTRDERLVLAKKIHPLLKTRGVPGTHDVELAIKTISAISGLMKNETASVPRFDKAIDDRIPASHWTQVTGPVDIIILEGWCVGIDAQDPMDLQEPVNKLEQQEDVDLTWRHYVNKKLNGPYQKLFSMIDKLLVLEAPSFSYVIQWRRKQEKKLIASLNTRQIKRDTHTLSDTELERFVQHYERLTKYALQTMPQKADWCLFLDGAQNFEKLENNYSTSCIGYKTPYVVFTDLDGTLLDHYSYSWSEAAESLKKLSRLGVPVIINTSKTADEVIALQKEMALNAPFIVENGSALYIPKDFSRELLVEFPTLDEYQGFYVLVFGKKRVDILEALYNERANLGLKFSGYYDWDIKQLIESTGLEMESAKMSMTRKYSEPFIWQDSGVAYKRFTKSLLKHNIRLLKGGRFEHAIGNTDKAKPIRFLKNRLFNDPATKLICLGDTNNDIAMLELADIPICVKSPIASFPQLSHKNVYHTKETGPKGWSEAINNILEGKI